jgi:hypothetical protein
MLNSALRIAVGHPHFALALVVGFILFSTASAEALSELQKLEATIPPRAKLAFGMHQSCALITKINKKGAAFADVEAAIAATCKKHLEWTLTVILRPLA